MPHAKMRHRLAKTEAGDVGLDTLYSKMSNQKNNKASFASN